MYGWDLVLVQVIVESALPLFFALAGMGLRALCGNIFWGGGGTYSTSWRYLYVYVLINHWNKNFTCVGWVVRIADWKVFEPRRSS